MDNTVLFSIVIPTYNRAAFITTVIEGFLKQSFKDFELIIVDDGGRDNTQEVVAAIKDTRIKYYKKENGERGAARKFGAAHATGQYINYFDSDDIPYSNHLETAKEIIDKNNSPAIFHLGFEYRNEKNELTGAAIRVTGTGNEKMLAVNYINPNPCFVHRSTLTEVTYCEDRRLAATEDWLYHLQLIARYELLAFGNRITCCMVQHDQRSMNQYSGDAVLERNKLLLQYLKQDAVFMKRYGKRINTISAEMCGLAALHYVLEGKKDKAAKTLWQAVTQSATQLFKRRTLAIAKYFIIK